MEIDRKMYDDIALLEVEISSFSGGGYKVYKLINNSLKHEQ